MLTMNEYTDYIDLSDLRSELDAMLLDMEAEIQQQNDDERAEYDELYAEWEEAEDADGDLPEPVEPDELQVEDHEEWQDYSDANEFCDEAEGYGDRAINEDEFTDYAQELAQDVIGADLNQWPMTCIDWDDAAEELKYNYSCVSWNGQDFYIN